MAFFLTSVTLDVCQGLFILIFILVFLSDLGDIDSNSWMALTASMIFVFLGGLCLGLTCISRRTVGLCLVILNGFVCLVFFIDGQLSLRYLESISFIPQSDCRTAFIFALTFFSIAFSHKSRSQLSLSI